MRPRVSEGDLAMLFLEEDDLVALGAMLSLPARSVDLSEGDGNGAGDIVQFWRAPVPAVS